LAPGRFSDLLREARRCSRAAVIADIKLRSPRDGELLSADRLESYLHELAAGGIDALATVTETPRFGGSLEIACRIRRLSRAPLMRKDFFRRLDQVDESAAAGFDALQLTLRTIGDDHLVAAMMQRADALSVEPVVGVHTAEEVERAVALGARIVGINNRDIAALETDDGTVSNTERLAGHVPADVLVISESGLNCPHDVARAALAGADAVLVATAFARSETLAATVHDFREAGRR
jgi:indole-3-glycerol phosphate synthase